MNNALQEVPLGWQHAECGSLEAARGLVDWASYHMPSTIWSHVTLTITPWLRPDEGGKTLWSLWHILSRRIWDCHECQAALAVSSLLLFHRVEITLDHKITLGGSCAAPARVGMTPGLGTGGATPYPYPSPQTLPITHTHTRQRVQCFLIPITCQGKRVPTGTKDV